MKINLSIIISAIVLIVGLIFNQLYLWIPITILVAGFIDLFTRGWVFSDRLGSSRNISIILKFLFSLIGFYALIGQVICISLIVWWFIF